jgi:hypothetical protein
MIEPMENGDELFTERSLFQTQSEFAQKVEQAAIHRDWLKDVWNKWPGDEAIEDIMKVIESK